jgi:hypothetical protein
MVRVAIVNRKPIEKPPDGARFAVEKHIDSGQNSIASEFSDALTDPGSGFGAPVPGL